MYSAIGSEGKTIAKSLKLINPLLKIYKSDDRNKIIEFVKRYLKSSILLFSCIVGPRLVRPLPNPEKKIYHIQTINAYELVRLIHEILRSDPTVDVASSVIALRGDELFITVSEFESRSLGLKYDKKERAVVVPVKETRLGNISSIELFNILITTHASLDYNILTLDCEVSDYNNSYLSSMTVPYPGVDYTSPNIHMSPRPTPIDVGDNNMLFGEELSKMIGLIVADIHWNSSEFDHIEPVDGGIQKLIVNTPIDADAFIETMLEAAKSGGWSAGSFVVLDESISYSVLINHSTLMNENEEWVVSVYRI